MRERLVWLVVAVLSANVVAGCSDEPPKFEPKPVDQKPKDMATADMPPQDMGDMADMPQVDMPVDQGHDQGPDMTDMCVAETNPQFCQRNSYECGMLTAADNCGAQRTVDCGNQALVCDENETCGGSGTAGQCGCTPTTCDAEGVLCGQIPDSCGGMLNCDSYCVDSVESGTDHACAIGSGKLKCWGSNQGGQLGNGSTQQANNPVDVVDLPANVQVIQVSAGGRHTCALLSNTAVKCWGNNDRGQLGVGTTVDASKPGDSAIVSGAVQVVAGDEHTCALVQKPNVPVQEGYGVKCWGSNEFGQIGDPSLFVVGVNVPAPKDVVGLGDRGVLELAAGSHHTCARMVDGTVSCWGRNQFGQLGNLAPNAWATDLIGDKLFPFFGWDKDISVTQNKFDYFVMRQSYVKPAISDVIALTAGRGHTCALTRGRELFCWGALADRAGGNAGTCMARARGVKTVNNNTQLCAYNVQTIADDVISYSPQECAIFPDSYSSTPGSVPLAQFTVQMNSSYGTCGPQTCQGQMLDVICPSGTCVSGRCQLNNFDGAFPNAGPYSLRMNTVYLSKAYLTPKRIDAFPYVESISSGRDHVCVLVEGEDTDQDGILDRHELGSNVLVPRDSDSDTRADYRDTDSDGDGVSDKIEAGDDDLGTPPVDSDGDNTPDFLDDDSDNDGIKDGVDNCRIVANADQADADNDMIGDACQGDVDGDTIADDVDNCLRVANTSQDDVNNDGIGDVCQVFDSNVFCFGINESSQLGNGSNSPAAQPALVLYDANDKLVRARRLGMGGQHSCVVVSDNNVKCWGSNKTGQIGNSALMREISAKPFDVKLK